MSQAWTPFKDLYQATDGLISQNRADAYLSTKSLLHLYKSDILSLLKNAPKNAEDRRKVNECEKNGICVGGDSIPTTFDEGFIADTLVLSDFLDLNERCSLELLLAAEQQKSNYLRCGRCLVSILMYWDGRRNLVSSLRNLILCRKESAWSFDLQEDCTHLATSFTDEVKQNGMVARVLKLLKEIKVKDEVEKIDHSPNLKGVSTRYLKEVQTLIEEVRVGLAECLLYFSLTKTALTFDEIAAIVEYLKDDGDSDVLAPTTMALLFTVLHSISLPRDEYENNIISMIATPATVTAGQGNHHLVEDHTILPRIHHLLTVRFANSAEWKTSGILSVLQFFWSLTIARVLTLNISSTPMEWNCMIEQEEVVLDASLAGNVFNFLRNKVVASDKFHSTEFYIRPVHGAITDLIRLMPLKTKSIRNRGDEEARHLQQMQESEMTNMHHHYHITTLPPQNNHFKYLMELIGEIYIKDRLNLSLEYLMNDNSTSSRPRHKHALLYKFVRSCGEQLPALLYASYIRMLCGIATGQKSSQKVFEMLRLNSPSNNEEKGLVSWDTFFRSCWLYYEELREKPLNNSHMGMMMAQINPATGAAVQLIKPHEVDALRAFMKLVATICKHDDICCKLFYENSNWCACDRMFGLLQCSIPVHLKADILAALANIATSYDDVRAGLLQMAQNCQLLTSNYNLKQSGLIAELEEIETKDEEFPMTRNFLKFLLNVCATFNNAEGMMEYMNYVIEVVFTKIPTRRYSRPEEQWQVAGKCLKIFIKILENHSSVSGDDVTITPASRELLTHIYSQGHFFNMLMKIIKSCLEHLNSYKKDERLEKYLVKSGELSLELILLALQLRDPYFDAVRSSKQNILLMKQNILNGGLDKLLLGVNSVTGKSDYIVDIMSFVIYNAWHPQLSLKAVKIMNHLCFSSTVNQRDLMMSMLTSCDKNTREKIFQGFVEILDLACDDRFDENMTEEKHCQEFVVRLIIHCSHQSHPNLALLLLGFGKNPAQANLQDPGVFGSPRTCLHSIIGILTCNLQSGSCVDPLLAQLCYNLVYKLCANPHTSASTLRYLRSSYDFFTKHLQCLPFPINDESKSNEVILQQSYLMKSAAIEIYSLINNQQRGNAERIMQLLFNASGSEFASANMTTTGISMTTHLNYTGAGDFSTTMFDTTASTMLETQQEDLKFLQILNTLDLQQMYPSPLRLEQFISSVVEEEIKKCENINSEGLAYCDVKTLHASLESSLVGLNGTDDANRKLLAQNDVQSILRCVVERNGIRETIFAKLCYLNAWKEIFEISISTNDLMPKEKYEQMLLSIATSIIGKVRDSDSELMSVFATSMLAIFTSIRDIMNETVDSTTGRMVKKMKELKPSFAASLKIIVQGIMEWVTQTDTREGVRVYLYSTLLSYLQLCTRPKHRSQAADESEKTIVNLSKEDIYSKMARENSKLFKTFGDSLISLLCKDACTGHIVCRTLALACMDSIIQIDSNFVWISYITKNGYLNNIAQSFVEEDSALCLDLNSSISQTLYVYEQKMALLCSMAQSPYGARELLDCGILQIFAGCKFFDSRLNIEEDDKKLSVYRQLVFPILRLCSSIFTSLGGRQHHGASTSVFNFLLSHADTLINPLFDNHVIYTDIEHLTEWKLVTGLLCQLPDVKEIQQHNQVFAALQRIQRQIVSSVSRIFLTEKELFQLRDELAGKKPTFDKICMLLNEIGANLFAFLRIFSITSNNSDVSNLYFSPNLNDVGAYTDNQKANVGILIRILQTAVKNHEEIKRVKQSRQVLYFIIENCLMLLWRHVEYFVLKCSTGGRKTKSILFPDENFGAMTSSNRQFSSSANQAHDVDLEKFKSGLRSALSLNGLLKQLTSFDGRNHLSIIPSITRHLQRIINLHTSQHRTF